MGIPGWRNGLAPAFGPGRDPGDPGLNPTSGSWCMEPASPSACVGNLALSTKALSPHSFQWPLTKTVTNQTSLHGPPQLRCSPTSLELSRTLFQILPLGITNVFGSHRAPLTEFWLELTAHRSGDTRCLSGKGRTPCSSNHTGLFKTPNPATWTALLGVPGQEDNAGETDDGDEAPEAEGGEDGDAG